jgi:DNA-damage-inducible protein D
MQKEIISKLTKTFEEHAYIKDGIEFWLARELQDLLGYIEWRNFVSIIEKAKISGKNTGLEIKDHFVDINKTIDMPKGAKKEIDDMVLTRYACYLIAQNGDSRKEKIAFAQSYFAIQTRKQELVEERTKLKERIDAREKLSKSETELSKLIYERGVDQKGFSIIRSKGDEALFGGSTTFEMKRKLNISQNRPLADFLPTVTIAAKNLATEMTNFNVKKENLNGEPKITDEHIKNNSEVRGVLVKNKIYPEKLPPEEDIKKLNKKLNVSKKLKNSSKSIK